MFGPAEELFTPGVQHAEEERQRLEHTRVEEGDHGPGCGPVDLDSGHVLIALPFAAAVLPSRPRLEEGEDGEDEPEGLAV
ncbi:DUF6191 domain-containing protein [Streptomyces sp. GSL17-111]|uniref:DUF6191 domain-containing protein n=1 Tax=Streptomyces sp. GSL17-111 TaxID=3121596 RepID=UPI0030F4867C